MIKRGRILAKTVIGICLLSLIGCSGRKPEAQQAVEGSVIPDSEILVPALLETGGGLQDFVPEGWTLLDSVELDFNEDGISDYVGVLDRILSDTESETAPDCMPPRILFAIASDGAGRYVL